MHLLASAVCLCQQPLASAHVAKTQPGPAEQFGAIDKPGQAARVLPRLTAPAPSQTAWWPGMVAQGTTSLPPHYARTYQGHQREPLLHTSKRPDLHTACRRPSVLRDPRDPLPLLDPHMQSLPRATPMFPAAPALTGMPIAVNRSTGMSQAALMRVNCLLYNRLPGLTDRDTWYATTHGSGTT